MEVDLLAVISSDDFVVNENITVHQPSLREIKVSKLLRITYKML